MEGDVQKSQYSPPRTGTTCPTGIGGCPLRTRGSTARAVLPLVGKRGGNLASLDYGSRRYSSDHVLLDFFIPLYEQFGPHLKGIADSEEVGYREVSSQASLYQNQISQR